MKKRAVSVALAIGTTIFIGSSFAIPAHKISKNESSPRHTELQLHNAWVKLGSMHLDHVTGYVDTQDNKLVVFTSSQVMRSRINSVIDPNLVKYKGDFIVHDQ